MLCGLDSSRQREIIIGNRHGDWTNWMRSTCEAGANQAKTWEQNCETGRAGKNQETKIPRNPKKTKNQWAIHTQTKKPKKQKNKKPKNQETKKPKKQKKKKKKTRLHTPRGGGQMQSVGSCLFVFFVFFGFLFFWFFVFFVFLVCVWIAIADVPSRDCQALSVVALEVGQAKTKKTKNQETKKPKNKKKNKKQKKQKKTRLHTPRGGGQMQSFGSCLFVFFVFFVFLVFWFFVFFVFLFFGLCVDSHCRCAKQRLPGTVSGCTRSKVDPLQYSNVCYDIVHSANEQQRGMEFNFVRLRHMLLDLCTGHAAICALPWWPVLKKKHQWFLVVFQLQPHLLCILFKPLNAYNIFCSI